MDKIAFVVDDSDEEWIIFPLLQGLLCEVVPIRSVGMTKARLVAAIVSDFCVEQVVPAVAPAEVCDLSHAGRIRFFFRLNVPGNEIDLHFPEAIFEGGISDLIVPVVRIHAELHRLTARGLREKRRGTRENGCDEDQSAQMVSLCLAPVRISA